jgi:putative membrane protein
MSERPPHRRPATFKLDDPGVIVMDPDNTSRPPRGTIHVTPETDPALLPVVIEAPLLPARQGFRWGTLFWTAVGGLVVLGLGLGVVNLIEDLFARSESLGFLGLALALLAALAFAVVVAREALGLARLATIEKLHLRAATVLLSDDRDESRSIVQDLLKLAHQNPQLARARATLQNHTNDIIDGADLIKLAERELMTPGALGMIRLMRHVIAHVAITGGMAASDSLIQQVLGHGIAAKLSQRLGEGILNGLLTARLGLAAIDVTRPLPFTALPRPALGDLAKDLLTKREEAGE